MTLWDREPELYWEEQRLRDEERRCQEEQRRREEQRFLDQREPQGRRGGDR